MKSLYPNSSILTKLAACLRPFFAGFSKRTTRQLTWLVIAMLAVGALHSARSLHTEFLSGLELASLNTLYYTLSYAKRPAKRAFATCLVQQTRLRLGRLIWARIFLFRWVRALQNDKDLSRMEKALCKRLRPYAKLL